MREGGSGEGKEKGSERGSGRARERKDDGKETEKGMICKWEGRKVRRRARK